VNEKQQVAGVEPVLPECLPRSTVLPVAEMVITIGGW